MHQQVRPHSPRPHQAQGQIEGSFQCDVAGEQYHYLASFNGSRSVDWHATIRCGSYFSWSTGTIAHNTRSGEQLEEAVRAHVLAAVGLMRLC